MARRKFSRLVQPQPDLIQRQNMVRKYLALHICALDEIDLFRGYVVPVKNKARISASRHISAQHNRTFSAHSSDLLPSEGALDCGGRAAAATPLSSAPAHPEFQNFTTAPKRRRRSRSAGAVQKSRAVLKVARGVLTAPRRNRSGGWNCLTPQPSERSKGVS
jgi:hypothetical protein